MHTVKTLATLLGLQSGTVFVYEWQEIGVANMPKTWGIDKLRNLESINFYSFSTVQPWMDVIDDYKELNGASQVEDLFSVYSYWQSIFDLRRGYKDIFVYGSFTLVDPANEQIFAYARRYEDRVALVITSFSEKEFSWTVPEDYTKPKLWRCSGIEIRYYHSSF
ncbi:hypothetical protein V1527DRAFT_515382 [Lipomyces starkeyi]